MCLHRLSQVVLSENVNLFLLLICVQIQMDRNVQRVRNGDMNPCIEVSLPSFTHMLKYEAFLLPLVLFLSF